MKIPHHWLFPSSLDEAKNVQNIIAKKISLKDSLRKFQLIGGMDVSYNLLDAFIYAAAVTIDFPKLQIVDTRMIAEKQLFPYIPGFLSFREAPALIHAFEKLKTKPDIILIDGQGISHPRKVGIASHIGVILDIPTIGVAKSILIGKPSEELKEEPGSQVTLTWQKQTIGMLLRTKKRCNPLVISAGHKISLETAVEIVKKCLDGYRLPEPTRQAHIAANSYRKLKKNNN